MRVVVLMSAVLATSPSLALAQEKPADAPSRTGGFFGPRVRVSFWKEDPKPEATGSTAGQTESLWAEPIRLPDGRMTTYVPPRQVLAFLENPTEEAAFAYIAWQKERMTKIARASEMLSRLTEKLKADGGGTGDQRTAPPEHPHEPKAAAPPPAKAPASGEILYFKKEGCPHCRHEDGELAALQAEHPGLKIKVLTPGEEENVWKAFGVEVVPTLIVSRPGGKSSVFRGFTPRASILSALATNEGESRD
jgi:hypothetical protein